MFLRCRQRRAICHKRLTSGRRGYAAPVNRSWGATIAVDEWVQRDARPISLRQLTVFGRSLTEERLVSSANYVRLELPTRIAHRLRDMQTLPYAVIANPHMSHVYELYWKAFETFRQIPEVKSAADNDVLCRTLQKTLREHMSVIPSLVMGVLESQDYMDADAADKLMDTLLRARISRRVIAEQHLALTETFFSSQRLARNNTIDSPSPALIGEVFLNCSAKEVVERCAVAIQDLARDAYGPNAAIPTVSITGHKDVTLTYIPSHLEYIIGELLRNSVQATVEHCRNNSLSTAPPIEVLICGAPQHVIFRISDQGGGLPQDFIPYLWSFVKGPRKQMRLENLEKVPRLAATFQELVGTNPEPGASSAPYASPNRADPSLRGLASRPPNLRLGIGLPMSRVFAEYWAGSLELHSLEGYGVDAFLQVSKLGNKNEQLSSRASMDAL